MEPDVIIISDDDDDDEPKTPVKFLPYQPKIIMVETTTSSLPTSPRTPGRLSLSYGKTSRQTELKMEEKDSLTITPLLKVEQIKSQAALSPVVMTNSCPTTLPGSSSISKEAKLLSLIEKFHQKKECLQHDKVKRVLILPVPASGPLEPYQRPENVNEVHSSTGSDEMKNNAITRMFDTCREFSTDKDDLIIIEKMWAKVNKCDASYTTSQKFLDFTQAVHAKILLENTNMHLYLKEFYDELAKLPSSSKPKSKSSRNCPSTTSCSSEAQAGASTSHSPNGGHEPDTTSVETGNEKHIQKLEKLLKKCSKQVAKLEEKEMSVDDLDDDGSIYLLIDRYKRRCLQIWKKLFELNGEKKAHSGRLTEKKFIYEGSRFPEVNKCISRLVNRSKSFPDFCDVTDLITQCNGEYDLHLRPFQIDTLAREAFKDIGKELKRRRIMDYEEHFGCPLLTEKELENDPASQDEELNAKLSENSKLGMKKAEEVSIHLRFLGDLKKSLQVCLKRLHAFILQLFESFVLKQAELDEHPPNPEASESQNEDESEEEDTEKEAPIDGADDESESESESKEEEVENEIVEQETDCENGEEAEVDIDDEELSDLGETELEAIDEEYVVADNTAMNTRPIYTVSTEGANDHQCAIKRSSTPEFLIQPPSKRLAASIDEAVEVRILHDMDGFSKPQGPDLSNQDSCSSEIFIIE